MKKTTRVKQKIPGRSRTGSACLMGFRADPVARASIIRWAEKQRDTPTLSEPIRRLVELGITIRAKVKQPSAARADRAKELTTKTIEKMMDPSASLSAGAAWSTDHLNSAKIVPTYQAQIGNDRVVR